MDQFNAGELRGQNLEHSPLHHAEHADLINNLPFIEDFIENTDSTLTNQSVGAVISATKHYHEQQAKAGEGEKYDPISQKWSLNLNLVHLPWQEQ